ncbi:MAG: hypothetical protein GXO25_01675 [Euryarchaeota archaeon]|nr:hypothetical protein [Euryarchaeota archaeon]
MGKKLHFKSKKSYNKWLAWNYEHNRKEMGDGRNSTIIIRGKKHKVKHSKNRKGRK